ncbi:MAG TPA: thioredoxin [Vicinamibacterales bacterium]|jgi:thioredoxin 2|nr:thioredoxin [Vicinamibacterales bacterium]
MGATADRQGVIVSCPSCGRSNRLRYDTLGKTVRCGNCRANLPPLSAPIEIADSATFDAAAAGSSLPLLVDFWAPWCGPCRMVAPELERVARTSAGRYLVVKVNTDVVTDVAARFTIRSIPTLALVFNGREIDRVTGVRPASEIEAFAARALAAATPRAS